MLKVPNKAKPLIKPLTTQWWATMWSAVKQQLTDVQCMAVDDSKQRVIVVESGRCSDGDECAASDCRNRVVEARPEDSVAVRAVYTVY